jgi:CheY-like chemotaxis protein
VKQIREAAGRATMLTKQLLAFSRKQVLHPTTLDVNAVVDDVFTMLSRVIPANITLKTDLDSSIGSIYADRGQIEQVLMNLATNARDAMPDGGTLLIETSSAYLDDAYLTMHPTGQIGPHVILTVRDTGQGMDAETQARVFEPFFTTKEAGKGTGLGLATVYGIVRQSGGSVYVYSEPGRGTTFKLYFPIRDGDVETVVKSPVDQEPVRPLRVLLAEDDPLVRDAIGVVLRRLGHTVTRCEDAAAAITRLEIGADDFDLVLSDVVMPGKSGIELADIVRRNHPQLPMVLVSGYSEEAVSGVHAIPADIPFVEKPFTAEDISAAIAVAMRLRGAPRAAESVA